MWASSGLQGSESGDLIRVSVGVFVGHGERER